MDFVWTPDQLAFRERVRAVLAAELPVDWAKKSQLDPSSE